MKKLGLFAAAAAVAALLAPSASAQGYLGASYGNVDADTGEADATQIDGAFGWNSGGWGGQIDGSFGQLDGEASNADSSSFAGHLYWGSDNWRLGGVIGVTNVDSDGGDVDEMSYGVEGSMNLGASAVLLGSATMGEIDVLSSDVDTWNIDGRLNFYAGDNFRFGGTYGFGNVEAGGFDGDTSTYGVDAEFQPFSMPVSFTVGWTHFEDGDLVGIDTDTLSVGARWNFGGGTLRERNNATPFDMRTGYAQRLYDIR